MLMGLFVRRVWVEGGGGFFAFVEMLRECALWPTWMIRYWPLAVESIVIDVKNGANWMIWHVWVTGVVVLDV
jgi:hypothetical protein